MQKTFEPGDVVYVKGEDDWGTVVKDLGTDKRGDYGVYVLLDTDQVVVSCSHKQCQVNPD